jgi:antitoxin component YwqK of YwqJK toxin-antitoxin module
MIERLPIDLIVEIGIFAGPDEYEQIANTSKRNAIILQNPHINKATNAFIVESCEIYLNNKRYHSFKYNGILHSFNDQPAIIRNDGSQHCEWYRHGKIHRDNGQPAIIYSNGKGWYQHGKLHRDNDQPAVIYLSPGKQIWYQHGKLHRDHDQPAIIKDNGSKEWYQHGRLHRDNDQPAIIKDNGSKEWYQHGKLYRDNDQPAIVNIY